MGRRRKDATVMYDPAAAAPVAEAVEAEVLADSVEEQEGAPVAVEVVPPVSKPSKWKVMEDKTVSLFGQVTLLPAGTVVSAASYGPNGLKRIMEQGVMLEPVA